MSGDYILDKYNVSVSLFVSDVIDRDMKSFGVKSRNSLCNLVISTFYELYEESRDNEVKCVVELLDKVLVDNSLAEGLAVKIIDSKRLYEMGDEELLKQKRVVLPIKVNLNTKKVIEEIINNIDDNEEIADDYNNIIKSKARTKSERKADEINEVIKRTGGGVSDYLRRLFTYYASMSPYKRERVIFARELNIIQEAIDQNLMINMVNKEEGFSFRFKPFAITTSANEQNAFVIGLIENDTEENKYSLFTMRLNKFSAYRIRKERKDIVFDNDYILNKYNDKVDDNFIGLLKRLNMIVDLVRKYDFIYNAELDSYIMDLSKIKKRDQLYYEDVYNYDYVKEIIIPSKYMDTVLSIPVKLNMMTKHDPNFAYGIDDDVLVKVVYTEEGKEEYNRVLLNRPEVIREENDGYVVYETSYIQASIYFRRIKGVKILKPNCINENVVEWHKDALDYLRK